MLSPFTNKKSRKRSSFSIRKKLSSKLPSWKNKRQSLRRNLTYWKLKNRKELIRKLVKWRKSGNFLRRLLIHLTGRRLNRCGLSSMNKVIHSQFSRPKQRKSTSSSSSSQKLPRTMPLLIFFQNSRPHSQTWTTTQATNNFSIALSKQPKRLLTSWLHNIANSGLIHLSKFCTSRCSENI